MPLAFGDSTMLTRGADSVADPDFEQRWEDVIREKVTKCHRERGLLAGKSSKSRCYRRCDDCTDAGAWEQDVEVGAYAVIIHGATAGRDEGLLYPLVQKTLCGAAGKEIWKFTAVRAVVEHKWSHWARHYLAAEFVLYLIWVACYSTFAILYSVHLR